MIYCRSRSTDPAHNLALEEAIFLALPQGESCFMLWQNDNTIVIGKNQCPANEINKGFVREHDIRVIRRITGGGAVYHDLGNVNFSFIAPFFQNESLDFSRFAKPVIAALASLGVNAEPQGRNDIAVNGFKVSGNAQYVSNGRALHHGTLLFDSRLDVLGKALLVSESKLREKGVGSVRSRVANIRDFGLDGMNTDAFIRHLAVYITREYGIEGETQPDGNILELAASLAENKYRQDWWVYGERRSYAYAFQKRFQGCGTVRTEFDANNGQITACRISGDFFGKRDISELEALLIGVEADKQKITERLQSVALSDYFHGVNDISAVFEDSNRA